MATETIIRPKKHLSWEDFKELWQYRELLYFFTWRDIKVRYKQTIIGVGWAVFQPFMTMVVFSIFFGHFAKMPSEGVPYPIFVFVGLLLWQFFSASLNGASASLTNNTGIVTKVYFPRLILPVSSTLTNFVDFAISFIVLIGIMAYYQFLPNLMGFWILPLLLVITFMIAVGIGMFLASINVKYRDVRYALPYFIQMLLFVTPVIYPPSIAGKYSWILALNPMTGVIKAARSSILGTTPINWTLLGISTAFGILALVIGVVVFKKTERYFADIV
ncbi:MAG: ABC transporter permease [bacterium]|nr:ABC transporter permease [bacterium]